MSSSPLYYNPNSNNPFRKRKARFTFSEVHILLDEVRKHRKIVVGKYNRGVATDVKKRIWAEITARVNEIGECQREVIEIIKKWSDLKCDTKRKVAAMQSGSVPNRGQHSRLSRELSPTEKIVAQILEMADGDEINDFSPLGDDDDVGDEEEEMDEEEMMGFQSSPNGGLETSMPPPTPYFSSGSAQPDLQFELPEDTEPFGDSEDEQREEASSSNPVAKPPQNHQENNVIQKPGPLKSEPSISAGTLPLADHRSSSKESLMNSVSESLREQHTTNMLLETVSRSLELLAESVQQLAETQQEFVRESLQLQRETVQVLRDFTSGAISLMHDKLNGRPAL